MARRWMVGVLGSGSEEHAALAEPLGRWLAHEGFDLLTGGGRGVMTAVCRAFHDVTQRRGVTVGILPAGPPPGYPNPYIDMAIHTHLPQRGAQGAGEGSRNHLIVLSAHVLVALPGGPGTRTEVELATRYHRPILAYLGDGRIEGIEPGSVPLCAADLGEVQVFILSHTRGSGRD
jgi:uncharacterized protein (TIGR00725 family)